MVNNFNPDVRNILNGGAMCHYLLRQNFNLANTIPFNEAMCMGQHTLDIFSEEFIDTRCQSLEIRKTSYMDEVCFPLLKVLEMNKEELHLWFDEDMFCQINLLVLLTYLEQINFDQPIYLNLVSAKYQFLKQIPITLGSYQALYERVILAHEAPLQPSFEALDNGIKLYLNYIKPDNEILDYIDKHMGENREELMSRLLNNFKGYGLGELQFIKLMEQAEAY